jgi:hypothetical protein
MSSNRLKYDKCIFDTDVKTNGDQYGYFTFKDKYEVNCQISEQKEQCYISPENRTDVENDLLGIIRQASSCPSKKYNPQQIGHTPPKYINPWIFEGIHYLTPTGINYVPRKISM